MSQSDAGRPAFLPDDLLHEFEQLGLSRNEARILLALLRFGSANTAQLSQISGVPRTSAYQILEELSRRGLAQRLSIDGPVTYTSPGRQAVFSCLEADQEERLRQYRGRSARLQDRLEEAFPDEESAAGPYMHVIHSAGQVSHYYDGLLGRAEHELLVFNRPPYSSQANPEVLEAVTRGVSTRVIYEAEQWNAPGSAGFRTAVAAYHAAGVEGRLVERLDLKLAIVDRKTAMLAMADPVQPEVGFPATLLIEHPGFAELAADAFDVRWASAAPLTFDSSQLAGRADEQGEETDMPAVS
jgi:sugar-specific transcriptional regulator TrmB